MCVLLLVLLLCDRHIICGVCAQPKLGAAVAFYAHTFGVAMVGV
jgi:hypothetical protein